MAGRKRRDWNCHFCRILVRKLIFLAINVLLATLICMSYWEGEIFCTPSWKLVEWLVSHSVYNKRACICCVYSVFSTQLGGLYTVGSYLILNQCLLNSVYKAVKMSQWVKHLPHKPEDLISILRSNVGRENQLWKVILWPSYTVLSLHTHTHTTNTHNV